MRLLIIIFLYVAYSNAYYLPPPNTPPPFVIEDRLNPSYSQSPQYNVGYQDDPAYNNNPPDHMQGNGPAQYLVRPNYSANPQAQLRSGKSNIYLRQGQDFSKLNSYQRVENLPYDPLNGGSDLAGVDYASPSYFEDLEVVESFANYLVQRTRLDPSSNQLTDAAHQYNAIMAVIIGLARTIRNACAEFDLIYDQIYAPTVETYYTYGLANAGLVSTLIEEYVHRGNSRITKIKKLKQDMCEKQMNCDTAFDSHINSRPLLYLKELEALKSLSHLARSFSTYADEFNQAALRGAALPYLQSSKDRLKDYIINVLNSVEHITDNQVVCP